MPWNSDKGQLCIKVTLMVFRENCSLSLRTQTLWGKEENLNSPHPHECNRFYPVKLNTKTWSKISLAQYLGHLCEAAWESSSLWFVCAASLTGHTSPPPYVSTRWVLIICPRLQWNASRSSWHEIIHRLTPCRLFVHGWLHTSSQCFFTETEQGAQNLLEETCDV